MNQTNVSFAASVSVLKLEVVNCIAYRALLLWVQHFQILESETNRTLSKSNRFIATSRIFSVSTSDAIVTPCTVRRTENGLINDWSARELPLSVSGSGPTPRVSNSQHCTEQIHGSKCDCSFEILPMKSPRRLNGAFLYAMLKLGSWKLRLALPHLRVSVYLRMLTLRYHV